MALVEAAHGFHKPDWKAKAIAAFLRRPRGLIGPNGAGKTTTMRAVSGLREFTRGSVRVGGHKLARDPGSIALWQFAPGVLALVAADNGNAPTNVALNHLLLTVLAHCGIAGLLFLVWQRQWKR